jgi:hypothetical protein
MQSRVSARPERHGQRHTGATVTALGVERMYIGGLACLRGVCLVSEQLRGGLVQSGESKDACRISQSTSAKLVYVRLAQSVLHVTAFRDRPKQDRNLARCPACLAPVTLRDGARRVPHAAHRPGTGEGCPATVGESALHLNTKIALGHELQAMADRARDGSKLPSLEIALSCLADADCPVPTWRRWSVTWDHVEIECRVGEHRPDIVLSLAGQTVGAIEVLVTHEISPEKAAALRVLNVPWLEVLAVRVASDGVERQLAWGPTMPLPVSRASQEAGQWYCPSHEAAHRLSEARIRYRTLKDEQGPARQVLVEYGRALAASEEEVRKLLAETAAVNAAADAEIDKLAALAKDLPARIAETGQLIKGSKRALEIAKADAAARVDEAREISAASLLQQEEYEALDQELRHYEGLRQRLTADFVDGERPGYFRGDARRTLIWRPIDIYRTYRYPRRHTATRGVFHIDRVRVPGKGDELWLIEDGHIHHYRIEASREDAVMQLRAALDRRLGQWREQNAIIDLPCDWVRVPYGESIPYDAWLELTGCVRRAYDWDEELGGWALLGVVETTVPGE